MHSIASGAYLCYSNPMMTDEISDTPEADDYEENLLDAGEIEVCQHGIPLDYDCDECYELESE